MLKQIWPDTQGGRGRGLLTRPAKDQMRPCIDADSNNRFGSEKNKTMALGWSAIGRIGQYVTF
jgi:hypothetical protein